MGLVRLWVRSLRPSVVTHQPTLIVVATDMYREIFLCPFYSLARQLQKAQDISVALWLKKIEVKENWRKITNARLVSRAGHSSMNPRGPDVFAWAHPRPERSFSSRSFFFHSRLFFLSLLSTGDALYKNISNGRRRRANRVCSTRRDFIGMGQIRDIRVCRRAMRRPRRQQYVHRLSTSLSKCLQTLNSHERT